MDGGRSSEEEGGESEEKRGGEHGDSGWGGWQKEVAGWVEGAESKAQHTFM